jgi:hypothetical protein
VNLQFLTCLTCKGELSPAAEKCCACQDPVPSIDGIRVLELEGEAAVHLRVLILLLRLRRDLGQWVTYDAFEVWRNRQTDVTPQERAYLTLMVAEHMIESLATNTVRYMPPGN